MRYLINKSFWKDLKIHNLDDSYVKSILQDILDEKAVSLGSKMYKIRASRKGQGKRGGFRNIFFWKREKHIIFCLLFGKNEQDNLTPEEMKALKILSFEYDRLKDSEIEIALKSHHFKEILYDKKT